MKRKLWLCLALLMVFGNFSGCQVGDAAKMGGMVNAETKKTREKEDRKILLEGEAYPYVLTDYMNNQFTIKAEPENWAVLSGTFLNIWYRLGGKSVCTTDLGSAFLDAAYSEAIHAIPSVGAVYNANVEKIAEIDPAFVIAQMGVQTSLGKSLETIQIPTALFHMRSFDDVIDHIGVFGKLLNNQEEADAITETMIQERDGIVARLPKESKSVVIMYVTSSSLAVKLDNSIAGDVAKILKLENIASDAVPDSLGSETTPLDVEFIAEKNPDLILVTSMISSNEDAKKVMEEEFGNNPVWQTVDAVKEGKIIYLPQEYFLYNAGHEYVKAIEYMAKGAYPEVYGELDGE